MYIFMFYFSIRVDRLVDCTYYKANTTIVYHYILLSHLCYQLYIEIQIIISKFSN